MLRVSRFVSVLSLILIFAVPACAAQQPEVSLARTQEEIAADLAQFDEFVSQGPPSPITDSLSQVIVEAGQANEKASVAIRWNNGIGVKLSTPVKKGAAVTDFSGSDGLATNTSLSVSWYRILTGLSFVEGLDEAAVDAICAKYEVDPCGAGNLEKSLEDQDRPQWLINMVLADFDRLFYKERWLWGLRLEGAGGYKEFEYFDVSASKASDYNISSSASISAVGIYGRGRISFGGSYERVFEDSSTIVEQCTDVPNTGQLRECKQLPLGEPKEKESPVAKVELRHIFGKWAISPLASWNFEKEFLGLELPMFFLANSDGRLTGGVRLGWRSDEGGLKASVFISNPLPLF